MYFDFQTSTLAVLFFTPRGHSLSTKTLFPSVILASNILLFKHYVQSLAEIVLDVRYVVLVAQLLPYRSMVHTLLRILCYELGCLFL